MILRKFWNLIFINSTNEEIDSHVTKEKFILIFLKKFLRKDKEYDLLIFIFNFNSTLFLF